MPFASLPTYPIHETQGIESYPLAGEQSSVSTIQALPFTLIPPSRRATPPVELSQQSNFPGIEREYAPYSSIPTAMPHATSGGSKPQISVVLDQPYLVLNGTGPDVESTRMSGKVVLSLPEATSLREITLQFRGKARIPMPASES